MTATHHLIFRCISYTLTFSIFIANIFSNNIAEIFLYITLFVCLAWLLINGFILFMRIIKDFDNAFHRGLGLEPIFFMLSLWLIDKFLF